MSRILVINPNSSVEVTRALDRALDPLRLTGAPIIATMTVLDSPPGIETQAQVDAASAHVTRLIEVRRQLRNHDGADVLILGCAGMARYRHRVEQVLALPVIDPTQAAVGQASTALTLGWRRQVVHKES